MSATTRTTVKRLPIRPPVEMTIIRGLGGEPVDLVTTRLVLPRQGSHYLPGLETTRELLAEGEPEVWQTRWVYSYRVTVYRGGRADVSVYTEDGRLGYTDGIPVLLVDSLDPRVLDEVHTRNAYGDRFSLLCVQTPAGAVAVVDLVHRQAYWTRGLLGSVSVEVRAGFEGAGFLVTGSQEVSPY